MSEVDTYILMTSLRARIDDYLYDPEPQYDAVLEDLNSDLRANRSKTLLRLSNELDKVIKEYNRIVNERIQDMEQFS